MRVIKKMSEFRCKRCNRILKNKESIERGYGAKCYKIIQLNNIEEPKPEQSNNSILDELLNRVIKLELDNNFMKHQLKHKFVSKSKDSELNWDIPKEVKEIRSESKIQFNVIVKELKVIFTEDFNYHNILSSINPIEELVSIPMSIEIVN